MKNDFLSIQFSWKLTGTQLLLAEEQCMEALPTHVSQIILGAAPWRNRSGVRIINRVCLEWSRASGSEEACGPLCQHFGTDITRRYSGQGTARDSFRSLFYEQQQMAQRLDLHGRWIGHGEVEGVSIRCGCCCLHGVELRCGRVGQTSLTTMVHIYSLTFHSIKLSWICSPSPC